MDGVNLGEMMWKRRRSFFSKFKLDIDNPNDSPLESAIKQIIKKMIQFRPADRINITEVVNELSALRVEAPTEVAGNKPGVRMSLVVNELSALREATAALVAANNKKLWVMTKSINSQGVLVSSEWEHQSDIATDHDLADICFCTMSDGIVALGGKCYSCAEPHSVRNCYHFSLSTRQWRSLPDMPTARFWASAVELAIGDILFLFGGMDESYNVLDVCEKFHVSDCVWSATASLVEPLCKPLVATAAGKVFIIPRVVLIFPGTKIQQYDPILDSFSLAAQLPDYVLNTWEASVVSAGDRLYLLGGEQRLAVQYSPAADQWVQLRSQPAARYERGCCAVVHSGKILLCGGSKDGDCRNTVEEYDTQTQQWNIADLKLPFAFNLLFSHVASIHL